VTSAVPSTEGCDDEDEEELREINNFLAALDLQQEEIGHL